MKTPAPINLIEITNDYGKDVPRIAGTRIRVSDIAIMHLKNDTPIEWMLENYEVLDHAKIYAALAYYYLHQAEIEAEINEPIDMSQMTTLADLKAKIQRRQAEKEQAQEQD
jgi:uncharacterized protein (DUF433 family)